MDGWRRKIDADKSIDLFLHSGRAGGDGESVIFSGGLVAPRAGRQAGRSRMIRDENGSDTDGCHWYHICFHIFCRIRIRIRIISIMSDKIWLDVDITNIWFKYSDTDTVSDIEYSDSDTDSEFGLEYGRKISVPFSCDWYLRAGRDGTPTRRRPDPVPGTSGANGGHDPSPRPGRVRRCAALAPCCPPVSRLLSAGTESSACTEQQLAIAISPVKAVRRRRPILLLLP